MKLLDRILQTWRIKKAVLHLKGRGRILDVGTHDGALFRYAGGADSIGIDPNLVETIDGVSATFVSGLFPQDLVGEDKFDAITILAVIEHLDAASQQQLAADCYQYLEPGGVVVVTTPSPFVDTILDFLFLIKVIDGMGGTHEDHYGFDPNDTVPVFEGAGLRSIHRSSFQFGLNNLFVFQKTESSAGGAA